MDDIAGIVVHGYAATHDVTGRNQVATAFEGRFSTPFTVATALVHGSVRLAAFTPDRLADPVVQALMHRTEVRIDPDLAAAFPGKRAANIEITLRDGRVLRHHQSTRIGDPDAPLSDTQLGDKFQELTAPVIGDAAAKALLAQLWRIDSAADVMLAPITLRRAAE